MTICYCGNHLSFEECCLPYLEGKAKPITAESLMRSRFSAFSIANVDYLIATTHSSTRKNFSIKEILDWCENNHWTRLEVLNSTETTVTFNAYYNDNHRLEQVHHEKSNFVFENVSWFYVDGE